MKKYNIGLDIGTTSVGYAVVEADTQQIIRKGNKKLWGVRLFEEAVPAASRRAFRSTRRRYDRRRERIRLLQEEFKEEINQVDPTFFTKLKESFFLEDDVEHKTVPITNEEKEAVRQHNDKYKTIYHLRDSLVHQKEQMDIRLVYLAIHHIIKYRGNFLYHSDSFNVRDLNIEKKLIEVFEIIANRFSDLFESIDYHELANILLNPSKSDRRVYIKECLKELSKGFVSEFTKLVNGGKFNFIKMFSLEIEGEKVELTFDGTDYDEKYGEFERVLGDDIELLQALKELYDMLFLSRLFKGSKHTNLSSLMVDKYEIHKRDLRFLKELFAYDRKLYHYFFRDGKDLCIYRKYVNNQITNDSFCKEIRKYLPDIFEKVSEQRLIDDYTLSISFRMDNGEFVPRITDVDNGKYPYQLNKDELIKIIENQGKYYPFLLDTLENGTYKIVQLLSFKIPYYVGPLVSKEKSPFAWMERNEPNIKITPYNFEQIVNKEVTAENFIKRMISHCTYLLDEFAMPTNSILYSKYKVINELKQIRVNGYKLTNEIQQDILKNLFMKKSGAITDKIFKNYLSHSKDFEMYQGEFNITGYSADGRFANNMQSYYDFFGPDGIFSETDYTEEDADQIIEWITIFEDKDILEKKVRSCYLQLNDWQIKQIIQKKYKGWGSLSKKLLIEKYYLDPASGSKKSIFDMMLETDENFMQVLNHEQYHFQKMIDECNKIDTSQKLNYKVVENLATSPATKRGIYQALRVVDEVVQYMGYDPESIVIEMAREKQVSKRTEDKKKYLLNLYTNAKQQIEDYQKLMGELNQFEQIDSQKLFLYFIQEGKSLYSGRSLSLEDLKDYEIDHIIPRTLLKDDSIDNKALVFREENQEKAASYVLPSKYRNTLNVNWWRHLKDNGLLSAKKFHHLIRKEYSEEDIAGFINRQLVETRQITKHVANILNNYYSKTKIVYLKAQLSHYYRERYELFKFRQINDFHHAHDAYLAAVLGEYREKHLWKKINFDVLRELNAKLIKEKDYQKLKYGFVINSLDPTVNNMLSSITKDIFDEETGEVLFDLEKFHQKVEYTLSCKDILISKKTEIRTGEFYQQTKNKKGLAGVPLKKGLDTNLYGSYTSLNPAFASLVKYTYKKKQYQKLIGLPIYVIEQEKVDSQTVIHYVRNLLKLSSEDSLTIDKRRIPFHSLLNWEGQICYLVGASDKVEVCNAKQFYFDKKTMDKYKYTLNKLLNSSKDDIDIERYSTELGQIIIYIVDQIEKEYKLYQNLVPELKTIVCYSDISSLSFENKEQIVLELFKLLRCNSATANFKFLSSKYSLAFGKKNSRIISSAKVNSLSVTGIRKRVYEF